MTEEEWIALYKKFFLWMAKQKLTSEQYRVFFHMFNKDIEYLRKEIECENCGKEICNIE